MFDLIEVPELAKYIRFAEGSIRQMVFKKKIPHFKVNGKVLFDRQEIDNWIKSKYVGVA